MCQLCPDYINRTATPALFAPLMTQTSYATSEVLYLLTYLLTYLLARDSIEGLSSVKAPPLTTRLTPSAQQLVQSVQIQFRSNHMSPLSLVVAGFCWANLYFGRKEVLVNTIYHGVVTIFHGHSPAVVTIFHWHLRD